MPKIQHRIIYDDDGNEMREGSLVLVNGRYKRVLHFDSSGQIDIEDFHWEDVETIYAIPDDRYGELEDNILKLS